MGENPHAKVKRIFVVKSYLCNSRKLKQDHFLQDPFFPTLNFILIDQSFQNRRNKRRKKIKQQYTLKAVHTTSAFLLAIWSSFSFTSSSLLRAATDSAASFNFSRPIFILKLKSKIKSISFTLQFTLYFPSVEWITSIRINHCKRCFTPKIKLGQELSPKSLMSSESIKWTVKYMNKVCGLKFYPLLIKHYVCIIV